MIPNTPTKMEGYSIGIDLGTTNSAVAWFDFAQTEPVAEGMGTLDIPQLTAVGSVESRPLLPSFLYLPSEHEFPPKALHLPWSQTSEAIVGEFARSHGLKVPARLVASAKSWLSHPGVDRRAAILPWQAPSEVTRVSPVEASACYLRHLAAAWRHMAPKLKLPHAADLGTHDVILTVPASFDAAARDLTIEAARSAGLENVTLLEEPQAALYAWLAAMGESFRKQLRVGDVILVVDVGGGTTDFSLIAVAEQQGDLQFARLAVGDHILLGGDNMDLTLAHHLHRALDTAGKKLDAWQFASLTHGCRQAKELLFADPKLKKAPIAVPGRGSTLVGSAIKTELTREDLENLLTDGFFPSVAASDAPTTARRTGLTQLALPYAQDPAVTRHLAAFLTRQARALQGSPDASLSLQGSSFVHPTAVLFNGGVFKATPLKHRVLEVLNSWLRKDGGKPARELPGSDLDLAVARGAAYYGWVRHGHGIRIRGGTARAYYVGVESPAPAVPGFEPPVKGLCVAPFGMEEGTQAEIPPQEFALVVGEPTRFRFFASSVRRGDRPGEWVETIGDSPDLEELAPIETTLPADAASPGALVPVNLQAAVTEMGTLELRCLEKNGSRRWKLELNVRLKGDPSDT